MGNHLSHLLHLAPEIEHLKAQSVLYGLEGDKEAIISGSTSWYGPYFHGG
jgi:rare lipoprotein A (peptidoglycan hydrolase)